MRGLPKLQAISFGPVKGGTKMKKNNHKRRREKKNRL